MLFRSLQDAQLLAAVSERKEEGWEAVAERAGIGASAKKCSQRWYATLEPLQQGMKEDSEWTTAEVACLQNVHCNFLLTLHMFCIIFPVYSYPDTRT